MVYILGKKGVTGILNERSALDSDINFNYKGLMRALAMAGAAIVGGANAGCGDPDPVEFTIASKRVVKGMQKPGEYTQNNRQDALVLTSCDRAVGCEDHTYFGLPTVVEETYRRAAVGDKVRAPHPKSVKVNGYDVTKINLLTPSPLSDIPYGIDLDVREVVLDFSENPITGKVDSTNATIKAVQVIKGIGGSKEERFYFLHPTGITEQDARMLRNRTSYHRTIRIRDSMGNGPYVTRTPGSITGVGADQHFDSLVELPYNSYSFNFREKTEVVGTRNDLREGATTQKGVIMGDFKEAPCGTDNHDKYT